MSKIQFRMDKSTHEEKETEYRLRRKKKSNKSYSNISQQGELIQGFQKELLK